jgi:hypothetical protein
MTRTVKKEREQKNPFEFYPTPDGCVRGLLRQTTVPLPLGGQWIEPCAGSGAIIRGASDYWRKTGAPETRWDAGELNPAQSATLHALRPAYIDELCFGDARTIQLDHFGRKKPWQVGCTNPPFSLAVGVLAALRPVCDYVVLLLRVGFFEAKKRYPWLKNDMPDIGILCPRPSFNEEGNDSACYAWCIWTPERRREGRVFLLSCDEELDADTQQELF